MKRTDVAAALLIGLLAIAWGLPTLRAGYEGPYDEGNSLSAALRVAQGERPYRDFWYLHGPASPALLGVAFCVLGRTLAVERGVKVALTALSSVLVFLLARRAGACGGASAAAAILFLMSPAQTLSLRPRDFGVAGALAAALLVASAPKVGLRRAALLSGAAAGATVWFKQDLGIYACAAAAATAGLAAIREAAPGERIQTLISRALLPIALTFGAALALLAAALASAGVLPDFVSQAVLFPLTEFRRFRALPMSLRFYQIAEAARSGLLWRLDPGLAAIPALFLVAVAGTLAGVVRSLRRLGRGERSVEVLATLSAGATGLLLVNAARFRADLDHLLPSVPFALVGLVGLFRPGEPGRRLLGRFAAGTVLLGIIAAVSLPSVVGRVRLWSLREETGLDGAPSWGGVDGDLLAAARFLNAQTAPAERIFVGNFRHDALGYNAPLLYFLAGRAGATRYDNLHPGIATTTSVQEEIIRSLERRGVRRVALWEGPPLIEPNASSGSSGVGILDDYLAARFRLEARFGAFRILRRVTVRNPATWRAVRTRRPAQRPTIAARSRRPPRTGGSRGRRSGSGRGGIRG